MEIMKTEHITSIQVKGYQEFRVETDDEGTKFVYLGDDYIAFTPEQYREFAVEIFNHQ